MENKGVIAIDLLIDFERLMGPQVIPILLYFAIASYTDIKDRKIYDWISGSLAYYNALVFVIIPLLVGQWQISLNSVLGGLLAFTVLIAPAMLFLIKAGGDIKFSGAAGLGLGLIPTAMWLVVSAFMLFIYGKYLEKFKGQSTWTVIPFAPFLFIGLLINLLAYILFI